MWTPNHSGLMEKLALKTKTIYKALSRGSKSGYQERLAIHSKLRAMRSDVAPAWKDPKRGTLRTALKNEVHAARGERDSKKKLVKKLTGGAIVGGLVGAGYGLAKKLKKNQADPAANASPIPVSMSTEART